MTFFVLIDKYWYSWCTWDIRKW